MAAPLLLALLLAPAMPADSKPRKICRVPEAQLGSHMKQPRTCRTEAEWTAEEEARRAAPVPLKAPQPESWERTRPQ
jgi:hypothetical protein